MLSIIWVATITGFALWNEEHTATRLFCPICFIEEGPNFYDEYGKFIEELIYTDECDWLHTGGVLARCGGCGRPIC